MDSSQVEYENVNNYNKGTFLLVMKSISFYILQIVFILQFECFLIIIIKVFITTKIILIIFSIIIIHFLTLRYLILSFVFIIQFPFFSKIHNYMIISNQFKYYLSDILECINLCNKIIITPKIIISNLEILIFKNCNETISEFISIYKEIRNKEFFLNLLLSWQNNFNSVRENLFGLSAVNNLDNNSLNKIKKLKTNLKDISNLIEDYVCDDYNIFSFKKIYNILWNDFFEPTSFFKTCFYKKFNKKINRTLITKDNKIIDYSILVYDDINDIYCNKNINKKNETKNLLIYCGPNGMIYQLLPFSIFEYFLKSGCDVLLWNYRGYGDSTGYPTFSNVKSDLIELFDQVKSSKYKKYGVYGFSVGGVAATFLAQQKNIDVCISDRNFSSIADFAKNIPFLGNLLFYLCKSFMYKYDYTVEDYINTKNKNCNKIILCDPLDKIIPNNAQIKSGISRFIIKQFDSENILDLFLKEKKTNFIENIIYLMSIDFNQKIHENELIGYFLNLKRIITKFFKLFSLSSEDLLDIDQIENKRLKILHIDNFFNNFFVWGTVIDNNSSPGHIINYNKTFFNTENNSDYLKKAINILNKFLSNNNITQNSKIKNINEKLIFIINCLQVLKNESENFKIKDNIGTLIRLNCGHNGLLEDEVKYSISQILQKADFLRK